MIEVIEVEIEKDLKLCSPNKYIIKKGVTVIVKTEKGLEFARVTKTNHQINSKILTEPLLSVVRISNKNDFRIYRQNKKDSGEAFKKCEQLIKKNNLNMRLIDAHYTFDRKQLLYHFVSDERVDFRKLAKELGELFKTRIELRQIGVRDKAQLIGGCGQCGRKLCCQGFLKDFNAVSINMVKNQNLSLNPTKINGLCGRLLCCLKYEDNLYSE